ncbi:MAG TPA: hypothetical protein DCG49_08960 [Ruminococcus sp.]|nr:hypothetical protein [Ruminococcus sp.]
MDLNKPNQDGNQSAYSGYEQVSGYQVPPQRERKTGLAIAALILGIISLIGLCCCGLNIITAPLAIIFGIVSIVKKRDGTGLSITGIVLAALSLVMMFSVIFSVRDILPYSDVIMSDYMQLLSDQDTVFPAYKEDQTLPEYLEKYKESPYQEFLAKYEMDIYDVMDVLLEQYENGQLQNYKFAVSVESSSTVSATETLPGPVI